MTTAMEEGTSQTRGRIMTAPAADHAKNGSIFQQEELKRERVGFLARSASLLVIACWFLVLMPAQDAMYYFGVIPS